VIERGESPRIVAADVVGSGGRVRVDGATLRARLGLLDTWAYFTTIAIRKAPPSGTAGAAGPRPRAVVAGSVVPARVGAEVQIQVREGRGWETVASTVVRRGGRYRAAIARRGTYRAVFSGDSGPTVRVR
jgi:stage II sporulation protein D